MPKLKKPLPPRGLDHLVKRYRDGRISAEDFLALKHWVESDPDVPSGAWYKHFKTGVPAGQGETALTFLAPGMAAKGEEIK